MPPRLRFAPSPTGRLHLGNVRTALVNWLFARRHQGTVLLRIDDTDRARSRPHLEAAIHEDLDWLGLGFDGGFRQSERTERYEAAFDRLRAVDRFYPCTETADELAALRAGLAERGLAPAYRRSMGRPDPSRPIYWRFMLPEGQIAFDDLVQGPRRFPLASLSDPVVRRADGGFTYVFASVVDDAEEGITHVIRGEDHLTNTAVQFAVFDALKALRPEPAHLPLLRDAHGGKLSKRLESLNIGALRGEGIEPLALLQHLAVLGTGRAADPEQTLPDLVAAFDLAAFNHAPARLDVDQIRRLSLQIQRRLPFALLHIRLSALGLGAVSEPLWRACADNIERLDEMTTWMRVVEGPVEPVMEDPPLARAAADLLPNDPLGTDDVADWFERVKARTGRRGRALFHPLRLAATGRGDGPNLKLLLPLIGRDKLRRRLLGETV